MDYKGKRVFATNKKKEHRIHVSRPWDRYGWYEGMQAEVEAKDKPWRELTDEELKYLKSVFALREESPSVLVRD